MAPTIHCKSSDGFAQHPRSSPREGARAKEPAAPLHLVESSADARPQQSFCVRVARAHPDLGERGYEGRVCLAEDLLQLKRALHDARPARRLKGERVLAGARDWRKSAMGQRRRPIGWRASTATHWEKQDMRARREEVWSSGCVCRPRGLVGVRGALKKVATQNELDAAKRALIATDASCHLLQLIEQPAVQHRHLPRLDRPKEGGRVWWAVCKQSREGVGRRRHRDDACISKPGAAAATAVAFEPRARP